MRRLLRLEPVLGLLLILTGPFVVAIRFSADPAPSVTGSRGVEAIGLVVLAVAFGFLGGAIFVRGLLPRQNQGRSRRRAVRIVSNR